MNTNVLVLGSIAIIGTLVLAAYLADKGHSVKIGTPFLNAQIN